MTNDEILEAINSLSRRNRSMARLVWTLVMAAGGEIRIPLTIQQSFGPTSTIITHEDIATDQLVVRCT